MEALDAKVVAPIMQKLDAVARQVDDLSMKVDAMAEKHDVVAGQVDNLSKKVDAMAEKLNAPTANKWCMYVWAVSSS